MSGTAAVPLDVLAAANPGTPWAGRPLCPGCKLGQLHPFEVQVGLCRDPRGWHGVHYLTGWVAVCDGNAEYRQEPCGFAMPLTPHRYPS